MNTAKQIEAFTRDWFDLFGFNYREIVGVEEHDNGRLDDAPLAIGDDLCMENIVKAADALGVPPDVLISMDRLTLRKQRDKYRFFNLACDLEIEYKATYYAPGYKIVRLMDTIFRKDNYELSDQYTQRYDRQDIEKRLIELLRRYDINFPGTFHSDAKITNLQIFTLNFCHFKDIGVMCREFLDMVDRLKLLFFKALRTGLTIEEINEYNLLVTITGLKDAVTPKRYLYYRILAKRKEVYLAEASNDFFTYVRLSRERFFYPYRCAEFVENKDLVQRFASIYPHMKHEMREFALGVAKFNCTFMWSDAKPVFLSPEVEPELDADFGPISVEERAKEITQVYVPKTATELNGDEKYAELLRVLSGPESLGGVKMPGFPYSPQLEPARIMARLTADGRHTNE